VESADASRPDAPEARCATHPDVPAVGTCARCGDFVCRGCADPRHPGVCARCGGRLPSGIAWEDPRAGGLGRRFLLTVRDVLVRPRVAFPGPIHTWPALAFAALCGLGLGAMLVAMAGALLVAESDLLWGRLEESKAAFGLAMGLALLLPIALTVLFAIVQAASFALGLVSVGRSRGAFRFALRGCGYAQGILLLSVLVPFVAATAAQVVGSVGTLFATTHVIWIVASAVWPVLTGRVCFYAGRGLGLASGRAAFAAFGPALVCTPIAAWVSHQQIELLRDPVALVAP
jgi:hypothetical protein